MRYQPGEGPRRGVFNQEKALEGTFYMIVKTDGSFQLYLVVGGGRGGARGEEPALVVPRGVGPRVLGYLG